MTITHICTLSELFIEIYNYLFTLLVATPHLNIYAGVKKGIPLSPVTLKLT